MAEFEPVEAGVVVGPVDEGAQRVPGDSLAADIRDGPVPRPADLVPVDVGHRHTADRVIVGIGHGVHVSVVEVRDPPDPVDR